MVDVFGGEKGRGGTTKKNMDRFAEVFVGGMMVPFLAGQGVGEGARFFFRGQ